MISNAEGQRLKAEAPEPIARCKWCIERLGRERYRVDGVWEGIFSPAHFFGDAEFTDGICPECLALKKAEAREFHSRGGTVAVRQAHILKVAGSNPAPATISAGGAVKFRPIIEGGPLLRAARRLFPFLRQRNHRGHRLGRFLAVSNAVQRLT